MRPAQITRRGCIVYRDGKVVFVALTLMGARLKAHRLRREERKRCQP